MKVTKTPAEEKPPASLERTETTKLDEAEEETPKMEVDEETPVVKEEASESEEKKPLAEKPKKSNKRKPEPAEEEATPGDAEKEKEEKTGSGEDPPKDAEEKPKRKKRRSKKEMGEKKKRKLNHQCAAVKICHNIMAGKRTGLAEEDQGLLAKFCQLNRGPQGIMFNKMCVKMREHLKEKYPALEKWEDMDFEDEEKKPSYTGVVDFLLEEYLEEQRKQRKEEAKEPKKEEGDGEKAAAEASA
jgi:hypothetical protein